MDHPLLACARGVDARAGQELHAARRQIHVGSPRAPLLLVCQDEGHVRRVHEARGKMQCSHRVRKLDLHPLRHPAQHVRGRGLEGVLPPCEGGQDFGPVEGPFRAGSRKQAAPARVEARGRDEVGGALGLFAPGKPRLSMARSRRGGRKLGTRPCHAPRGHQCAAGAAPAAPPPRFAPPLAPPPRPCVGRA